MASIGDAQTLGETHPSLSLTPVPAYNPPVGITAQAFSVPDSGSTMAWAISVIAFDGAIPDGSAGREHAEFIKLACLEAMARQDAKCIVMDFRRCDYRWGNSIDRAFDALRRLYHYEWYDLDMTTPVKVLASERSIGLQSLLPDEMLFDSIESAIASCNRDLEKWAAD